VPRYRLFREYDFTSCFSIVIMIPMLPPPPVRHFTVSRVWPCSSCGYLAKSDISSAACPNCEDIGPEGVNTHSHSSSRRPQSGSQGISSDSALSEVADQDGFPDSSTLFIPAAEASGDIFMSIRSCLGTNVSVNFGEFPVGGLVISKFYANQLTGRFVRDYCYGISYSCSPACYSG